MEQGMLKGLTANDAAAVISAANSAVDILIKMFWQSQGWEGRRGGYFCLADGIDGLPLLIHPIGEMRIEKASKYLEYCQEKARRLASNPGHLSSWESRNPEAGQWGGAIKLADRIYSFSGFPELADEAAMMGCAGAYYTDSAELRDQKPWLYDKCAKIAALSNNSYWGHRVGLNP